MSLDTSLCVQSSEEQVYRLVCDQLMALHIPGLTLEHIRSSSHLIDDVGVDSLKFVDLTVGLEGALCLEEFPMQEWIDSVVSEELDLTVGALSTECMRLLRATAHRS